MVIFNTGGGSGRIWLQVAKLLYAIYQVHWYLIPLFKISKTFHTTLLSYWSLIFMKISEKCDLEIRESEFVNIEE